MLPRQAVGSAGDDACLFAESLGYEIDDWQRWLVNGILSEDERYHLCATLCLILVSRQNGKNVVLEIVELYAFYVLDWREIIHTAHLQDSSAGHMARLRTVIEANEELASITDFLEANGKEKIRRRDTRAEIRFMTRSKKIGRSKSPRLVVIDEALFATDEQIQAIVPSMSAQSLRDDKPIMIYTSSAPVPESLTLHRLIRSFVEEGANGFFADWGCPPGTNVRDRDAWYASNPGLGIRIGEQFIEEMELTQMTETAFAIERLGVIFAADQSVSELPDWPACGDRSSRRAGQVALAVDVAVDLSWSSISIAGLRSDGLLHVEVIDCLPGTKRTVARLLELSEKFDAPVWLNPRSEAGGLISDLAAARVKFKEIGSLDYLKACVGFRQMVQDGRLRHIDQDQLNVAVATAAVKAAGEGWVWSPRSSGADISPLVATTIAAWAAGLSDEPAEAFAIVL